MRTLSQKTLNNLIFGRLVLMICVQILVFVLAMISTKMTSQDLDVITLVNIAAITSCVAMLNSARKGLSSIFQNTLIMLFDALYLSLLILISGRSCSPFIVILPMYIFFSSISLRMIGVIFSTTISVILVMGESIFSSSQTCPFNTSLTTASIIILFALLSNYIVSKEDKRAKKEQDKANALAVTKDKLLDNVVSILAHEIKNPVSSLAGVSDLIKADDNILNIPEQKQKLLGIITRETSRLANLTEEFLIYSGSEKRRNERIDIDALINICCESIRAHKDFLEKELELSVHSENSPNITYGDFQRLEQAFTNILINAVQACNSKGTITCFISSTKEEIITTITNDGERIPQHLIDRIFSPFFTTKDKGTGLGLAIVKNIIHAHDGKIHIESSDSDTSFRITFPKRDH